MTECLYVAGRIKPTSRKVEGTLETVIALFVLQHVEDSLYDVVLVDDETLEDAVLLPLPKTRYTENHRHMKAVHKKIQQCQLPAIDIVDRPVCVAGLCAILRRILKRNGKLKKNHYCESLLGFRKGCLMACAEVSVWTKFCEVTFLEDTKKVISSFREQSPPGVVFNIPESIMKLDTHLKQPVRVHNRGKREQTANRKKSREGEPSEKSTSQSVQGLAQVLSELTEELKVLQIKQKMLRSKLAHKYAEGIDFTLADIILFTCTNLILTCFRTWYEQVVGKSDWACVVRRCCPNVVTWYQTVSFLPLIGPTLATLKLEFLDLNPASLDEMADGDCQIVFDVKEGLEWNSDRISVLVPYVEEQSIYIRDPCRNKPKSQKMTKQSDIDEAVALLEQAGINAQYCEPPWKTDNTILDWKLCPSAVSPTFGSMPGERGVRKQQQVLNIVTAVAGIAREGDVIVDFCSGAGHVGVALAYRLPKCTVILVENKEESVARAEERINILQLKNAYVYQSNLDYFCGSFTIGVCLHACGVATDLVLKRCVEQNAAFVCCPCCYGSIGDSHLVSYPRSAAFRSSQLFYKSYVVLSHASDQTHFDGHKAEQGKQCMGLIDLDRANYAKENGYVTSLYTMDPPSCTLKNNMLIGMPMDRNINV